MNGIRDLIVLIAIPFIGVWVLVSKVARAIEAKVRGQ